MKFNILLSAIVLLPVLLSSCNSSKSTDSGAEAEEIDLTGFDDYKGVANGKVTIGEKTFPIEFIAGAYSKTLTLNGSTDLAQQDSGWEVHIFTKTSTNLPQEIDNGLYSATVRYGPSWDSTVCAYNAKTGTVTIESFIAKKSGTENYFTTSGKASFTASREYRIGTYSPITCPDISVEVVFTKVNVYDRGLNL